MHAYTEDQLVEQPTIGLFAEPGWTTVSELKNLRWRRDPAAAALPRPL
jgi:type I restriction enzyme R subunit